MMETNLKDPGCRTLFFAFKQRQQHCVLREDFRGASQAKLQVAEVTRLGRQLDACRALHKATIDSSKATADVNLDDADAIRKIRNQKEQKMKRDVMREREEQALLSKLEEMREEAISQSKAIGVVVGLDSFLSRKTQEKEQKLEQKAAIESAGLPNRSDEGSSEMISNLADIAPGVHVPVETYTSLHKKLEATMRSWLLHSNTEELCFPPTLSVGQQREMDFVIVLFGNFFTRMLFSGSALLIEIALQCLDVHLPTLAAELGAETVFKTVIFLLTVLMTTKHGIEDESVRDSAIHLCRTIFTDSEGDEDDEAGGGTATDMAKMLFQAIDQENTGSISPSQLRNSILQDTRVRELLLSQSFLDTFLTPDTELDLFAGYEDSMDEDTFCERIQVMSPPEPHPFHVFCSLSNDTMRVGVVALMPHLIDNIGIHLETIAIPKGCCYGTEHSTGKTFPLGGGALFDIDQVAVQLDIIHQIAKLDKVGVEFCVSSLIFLIFVLVVVVLCIFCVYLCALEFVDSNICVETAEQAKTHTFFDMLLLLLHFIHLVHHIYFFTCFGTDKTDLASKS